MKHTYFYGNLDFKIAGAYYEEIYKPPYEKNSTIIVVSTNKIKRKEDMFTIYDNIPLKLKLSLEENIEADVIEIRNSINLWVDNEIERIFLMGEDIFKLKSQRLIDISNLIHKYFHHCKSIGCFSTVKAIEIKGDDELHELRRKGYDSLTVKMDINENKILNYMKNGYESDEIVNQCLRLDESKIKYNIFYEEGKFQNEENEIESKLIKEILNELHPRNILTSICK